MQSFALSQRETEHHRLFEALAASDKVFIELSTLYRNSDVSAIRDLREGTEGKSLLHMAARLGNMKLIQFLIK